MPGSIPTEDFSWAPTLSLSSPLPTRGRGAGGRDHADQARKGEGKTEAWSSEEAEVRAARCPWRAGGQHAARVTGSRARISRERVSDDPRAPNV